MPGNELITAAYIIENLNNQIIIDHLGLIHTIEIPVSGGHREQINFTSQLGGLRSSNSYKKADFYLNGSGISAKQKGSHFDFNRLRRADLPRFFDTLQLRHESLKSLDSYVLKFHGGELSGRDVHWQEIFSFSDFLKMTHYLMMIGSPVKGDSLHKAEYILEAPRNITNHNDLLIRTFEEYFIANERNLFISIRRSWFGQASNSEHNRARGIINNTGNEPWVFSDVSGHPRSGWNPSIDPSDRKTAYYCMITKK